MRDAGLKFQPGQNNAKTACNVQLITIIKKGWASEETQYPWGSRARKSRLDYED